MKIYIINLKRRTDRRASILKQLQKFNITDYEFIDAFDGLLINSDFEANHKVMNRIGCKLVDNEIACAMSHRLAYNKIIQSGKRGIILEDDAILSESFSNLINADINEDIDILFFGYFTSNIRNQHAKPLTYQCEIASESISEKGETTLCYFKNNSLDINGSIFYKIDEQSYNVDFIHGAHAYSPSIDMCVYLSKIQNKIIFTADGIFNNLRKFNKNNVNYYATLKPLVNQDVLSTSDLMHVRLADGFSKEYLDRVASETFGT